MSSSKGGETNNAAGADASSPQLSRNSRTFLRTKLQKRAKKNSNEGKGDSSGGAKFQKRSLQCLKKFTCPVCRMKGAVRIDVNAKEQQAVVSCSYCMQLKPRPIDLPYPFTTSFLPKLQNRADVFFEFNELYRRLQLQANSIECAGEDVSGLNTSHLLRDGVLGLTGLATGDVTNENNECEEGNDYEEGGDYEEDASDDDETVAIGCGNEATVNVAEEETVTSDVAVDDVNAFFDESD
ncbi:hypothetical protein, conserved [Trypanosoma brucei gambiense DAL972]|uniref:Transcription elongation factor 1 homolog n=1 Tax=Trypanosoma brucei gambiense (strain MHOM/CI/86/DAL972) TaxID=679716 RepID=C9ZIA8_TRYB9|nr:hypothetical protein, conserved [Trypanosoma brucei gambiense DAL972]CBH08900.1 hypothetical protein, conserved [Trypanosoma brucei gambiense DAL972]|eukprot:XP_011771341.1 hypothetical protein, conserved [Trypanosoma brucei gambiense DAL972]